MVAKRGTKGKDRKPKVASAKVASGAAGPDVETVKELVLFLHRSQAKAWGTDAKESYKTAWYAKASSAAKKVHSLFMDRTSPATCEQATEVFTSKGVAMGKRPFMFFPPLERNPDFLPILYLPRSLAEWQGDGYVYRVVLYRLGDKCGDTTNVYSLGLRFEGPHGGASGGAGRHDFWHVQLVRSFPNVAIPLCGCPVWLPETVPSMPLYAGCPASSLLCVLASLYGGRILKSFLVQANVDSHYSEKIRALCPAG